MNEHYLKQGNVTKLMETNGKYTEAHKNTLVYKMSAGTFCYCAQC